MRFTTTSLASLALILSATGSDAAGRLGQPQPQQLEPQNERELQSPTTVVLNALIETFLPAVVDDLENEIAQDLDPILLDFETSETVTVTLSANDSICFNITGEETETAVSRSSSDGDDDAEETTYTGEITYYIGEMTGMGTMDIQSVVLQDGTDDIYIPFASFFGQQGSTWSGVWDAEAKFDEFVLSTTATLNMTNLCENGTLSYTEVETGEITFRNPTVTMTIYVEGETGNIYKFNDESTVTVATVRSISMTYDSVEGNLGQFDDHVVLDASEPFTSKVDEQFAASDSEFFSLLIGYVQEEVDKEIPFSL